MGGTGVLAGAETRYLLMRVDQIAVPGIGAPDLHHSPSVLSRSRQEKSTTSCAARLIAEQI